MMRDYSFVEAVRKQQNEMAKQARALLDDGLPVQPHMCECEKCMQGEAQRARAAQPWTSLAHSGSICAPTVRPTDPVNSIVFWNMVHVLQELRNLTAVYATPDVPAVHGSALFESLQGHATPSTARENPLVQFFDASMTSAAGTNAVAGARIA